MSNQILRRNLTITTTMLITVIVSTLGPGVLSADDGFPEQEIKVIVNYAAGGAIDRTARSIQKYLPDVINQSVIVENHAGAGGKIGLQKFLAAKPDGHTVLTAFAPGTTLVKHKDSDVFKMDDLAIINVQWSDPVILVAHKNTGWRSLEDMISAVRENPGKFSFGSSGKGAAGPLLSESLFGNLDLDVKIVPYQGGGKTRAAFKGGHVDMTAAGAGGALSIKDDAIVLGSFWNGPVKGWPDAKPINTQLQRHGITVPTGGSYRFHATHRSVRDNYPQRWQKLVSAFKTVTSEYEEFKQFTDDTGIGREWLGPDKSEQLILEVDEKFTDLLNSQAQ